MENKLTDKQLKFIDEYMIDLNATQAAIRAGYSVKTAKQMGTENLSKPIISNEIDKRKSESSKKALVTREEILLDLKILKAMTLDDPKTMPHALKAIEILNKMLGFNEPDKLDHTTNGNDINPTTINIHIKKK